LGQKRFEANRYFLKDLIRQEVDFSDTAQSQQVPAPALQKPCPDNLPRIELPDGADALARLGAMPIAEAIVKRESRRDFDGTQLSLEELSALLWATQGVRRILGPGSALRTVPSAGARHAFETYLTVANVENTPAGLYRYLPFDGMIVRLYEDERIGQKAAVSALGQRFIAEAAVTFFWTVIPARCEWRYDLAAHKVLALDAGHVCQNLYLTCESIGAGTCAVAAYDQVACDRLLGVDGEEEFTIYIAPVGK